MEHHFSNHVFISLGYGNENLDLRFKKSSKDKFILHIFIISDIPSVPTLTFLSKYFLAVMSVLIKQ